MQEQDFKTIMYPLSCVYLIPRMEMETEERWAYRRWFVAKQKPKTYTEFNQAVKWSLINTYIQYDKVVYSDEIMDTAKRMRDGLL